MERIRGYRGWKEEKREKLWLWCRRIIKESLGVVEEGKKKGKIICSRFEEKNRVRISKLEGSERRKKGRYYNCSVKELERI